MASTTVLNFVVVTVPRENSQLAVTLLRSSCLPSLFPLQVLNCLHGALQAVDLDDSLLRVSVGLRLALHLQAADELTPAVKCLREVSQTRMSGGTAW